MWRGLDAPKGGEQSWERLRARVLSSLEKMGDILALQLPQEDVGGSAELTLGIGRHFLEGGQTLERLPGEGILCNALNTLWLLFSPGVLRQLHWVILQVLFN